jgi:hypothetical protein
MQTTILEATFVADELTQQFAQDALAIQDAVNYGAIARCLVRHLDKIGVCKVKWNDRVEGTVGGDSQMKHPCVVLFTDKLASLAGVQSFGTDAYSNAYQACRLLSEGQNATIQITPI